MTLDEAKQLRPGQTVYELGAYNADGTAKRWKVNGAVKGWKNRPGEVRVPVKHGLYTHDYVTQRDLDRVTLTEPAPQPKAMRS